MRNGEGNMDSLLFFLLCSLDSSANDHGRPHNPIPLATHKKATLRAAGWLFINNYRSMRPYKLALSSFSELVRTGAISSATGRE